MIVTCRLRILVSCLATISALSPSALRADDRPKVLKDKYHIVQVNRFTSQTEVDVPSKYLQELQDEICARLKASNKFTEVLLPQQTAVEENAPILQVTGTVTRFQPGSRAERYLIGFGAGTTKLFGHLVFLDRSTGMVLNTVDVRGDVQAGLFGGESLGVTHAFAQRVVETARLLLEKRLVETAAQPELSSTADASSSAAPSTASSAADVAIPPDPTKAETTRASVLQPSPDRHTLTISSGDFDDSQKKLSAEGAAGYRIVGFVVTGSKTADISLEKSAGATRTYEYVILHGRTEGGLRSQLNKHAEDGYHLVPNNLALFGGVFACIMENPSSNGHLRYQYKFHATVRVSAAQRDIEKEQMQGYTLAGTANQQYLHIVLLEKEVQPSAVN